MKKKRFTVTEDHLKCLRRLNIYDNDGPEIDGKRPFGNSDYRGDILEILGEEKTESADGEGFWTKAQGERADKVWCELGLALQIALCTASFETGTYEQQSPYHNRSWEKLPPLSYEAQQAQKRPGNFNQLSGEEQWAIDKRLGILDWDGS